MDVIRQTSAIGMNGGPGSPAKSVFDPYDTTSLHIFIREAFPGAVLLEEHQVYTIIHKIFVVKSCKMTKKKFYAKIVR